MNQMVQSVNKQSIGAAVSRALALHQAGRLAEQRVERIAGWVEDAEPRELELRRPQLAKDRAQQRVEKLFINRDGDGFHVPHGTLGAK